jgi:hypothetical protein
VVLGVKGVLQYRHHSVHVLEKDAVSFISASEFDWRQRAAFEVPVGFFVVM